MTVHEHNTSIETKNEETIEEFVATILNEIINKINKKPKLQRSFSCDYDKQNYKPTRSNCFIINCECDLKKKYNETIKEENKKRRNSIQFASYEDIFNSISHLEENERKETSPQPSLSTLKENEEDLDQKNIKTPGILKSIFKMKKSSSTLDISNKPLKRSSSFLKKQFHNFMNSEKTTFLKRSFSFRSLNVKNDVDKSRKRLSELKNEEWAKSYQSLVENDLSVSYADLSFVDYDQFDSYSYVEEKEKKKKDMKIYRTQSMHVNGSYEARRISRLTRGKSVAGVFRLDEKEESKDITDIKTHSDTVSLPSLHHLNEENVETLTDSSPSNKERRRPQSIHSDDYVSGICLRCTESGYSKLESSTCASPELQDDTVRSRSLNHLDTLEMRQGMPPPPDTSLKDARSEPDCTHSVLARPATSTPCETPTQNKNEILHRRYMLSKSQKSSSECFSVNFDVGDESTYDNDFIFPATRGINLNDALLKQCELRNIDLSSCDAWLTDRENFTQTWLCLSQDTGCLIGKHVKITYKDPKDKFAHSRKLSGNFRPKTNSFFSSSTEDANISWQQDTKSTQDFDSKKQIKQRWSGLFGNSKDTKQSMDLLIEQLNNYSKSGVPGSPTLQFGHSESIDALHKLEDDWRDIIDVSVLSDKQQKQQSALWELIKTEVAYIKTLKVVTGLFLACLLNLQASNILKEIDTSKLFSNINDILNANVQFWRSSLFPMVHEMRTHKQPPCFERMYDGFIKIRDGFEAYHRFCGEQARCQHYCRENLTNDLFTAYLAWCETQKECNRLRLMDILVQPLQRLTKYGLLLKAILKNTDDETDRESLMCMIQSVDEFVNNVNTSLKQKQDNERLKGIIARIESYDIVETRDDDLEKLVRNYNQLDLNKPMLNCPPECKRHLLLEGDLKLRDNTSSKTEVHCFLLTDMLLVCKSSTKKGGATMQVIRQPYLVDRLVVTEINKETPTLACIYKNEFDMAVGAFLLQNNDLKKLKSWKEGISKAQNLYLQAKQSFLVPEDTCDREYSFEYSLENDFQCSQLVLKSPIGTSSRASRVSSLAHSHSSSVEMNDQSSIGNECSRAVSVENDNRTASISSDEGVQSLQPENKSPGSQKNFKQRFFINRTPNTLSVQPYSHNLGQSLPNLSLGSPNTGTCLNVTQNTLSVPSTSKNGQLSPSHRGISYPPPSPTRNLRRGLAINQNKNPPLIKTRHVNSSSTCSTAGTVPASFDFDVPVIAGASSEEPCNNFSRGQNKQTILKRFYRNDNKRFYTTGTVDDIKKSEKKDSTMHKRLSWNYNTSNEEPNKKNEET